jgi:hypothetical protein
MKRINISLLYFILCFVWGLGGTSCDQDEVFEKEQYKNVFALISGDNNVYSEFFDMSQPESSGYVSTSCGGSNKITRDINISLVEDQALLDNYNKVNYDVDYDNYALSLPAGKYDIDSYRMTIKSGTTGAELPVRIRPNSLSPDSVYFLPLRIDSHDTYEANPEKSYVLYRVMLKNRYARSDGNTYYTMRAKQSVSGGNELETPGTKIMHPLSGNRVRIMAGTTAFVSDIATLKKSAIILEVGDNNNVRILPYGDIDVTTVAGDPNFPNIFKIEDDGYATYKTFLLRYNYVVAGVTYEMKEELRLSFNPDDEENS